MLICCDFDGTATRHDTIDHLCRRFAPDELARLEGSLLEGHMTLHDVLRAELGALSAGGDDVVEVAIREVPLRDGFVEFTQRARELGHRLVIVSAGFRELIEPMLEAAGVRGVELIANSVTFSPGGAEVTFADVEPCSECGQPCKRAQVLSLRADGEATYIGDGFSDRCAAQICDRVFARSGLATWLAERDVHFEPFDDFHDVMRALGWDRVADVH